MYYYAKTLADLVNEAKYERFKAADILVLFSFKIR